MMDGMDMGMDRSKMTFLERLLDWLGRLHPMIVHFPIAFFPAALLTAIAGRRKPAFATPVQFLVVAGAIFAPIAAGAGWLAGIGAEIPSSAITAGWALRSELLPPDLGFGRGAGRGRTAVPE